ncbi:hypothetical protein IO90_04500 [Chryseobacterium sp. FH1]|nr:hypothetical protein IO90_04500 [Chryseobacterium sp. FH1]
MNKQRTANKVLPKAGLNGFDWIFVQGSTFVLRLNFCTKIPAFGNTRTVICHAMKTTSNNNIFIFLIIFSLFWSCSKYEKSQITNVEKLSSPNNQYDVYLYNIESGMSFGSTVNALQVVKYQEKPDLYNGDFFRVQNSRPFKIEWKNNNLIINTISQNHSIVTKQPFKTETQNYKGISIKNNVFTMFSSMAMSEFKFSKFYEKNGKLIFKNENDSLVYNNENSQIIMGSNYLEIKNFEKNKFDNNRGLSFDAHKLIPKNNFDFNKLEKFQPLRTTEK